MTKGSKKVGFFFLLVADGASHQVATRQLQTTDFSARDATGTKVTRVAQCRDTLQSKDSFKKEDCHQVMATKPDMEDIQ